VRVAGSRRAGFTRSSGVAALGEPLSASRRAKGDKTRDYDFFLYAQGPWLPADVALARRARRLQEAAEIEPHITAPVRSLQITAAPSLQPPEQDQGNSAIHWIDALQIAPHRPFEEPEAVVPPRTSAWLLSNGRAATVVCRLLDTIPALCTWLIVLSPLWAGYFVPLPFAVAIVAFDAYWVYLSISTAVRAHGARRLLIRDAAVDWHKLYRAGRIFHRTYMDWDAVRHLVVIPNYRESEAILCRTLASIAAQPNAAQVYVILAMEGREAGAAAKAARLTKQFAGQMGAVYTTFHPAGIAGEVAGKSANEAWAAHWVRRQLVDRQGWDLNATTITSCDADTVFHSSYFACLTYKFTTDPQRYRRFWQSAILLNNNIWDAPAPLRVASSLAGVHILSNLARKSRMMFPQSTYSLSLRMADDVGYWDPDVIPEDWHMFLKCFYSFRGKVAVEPIFLPTGNDAVDTGRYSSSLKMAYVQHKRHAWGSSDVPYAIVQSIVHPEIGLVHRARRFVALMSNHLIWSTHWFILSLGWFMPHIIARLFGQSHSPVWLPLTARGLLWLCLIPYATMFFLDRSLRPAKPAGWTLWRNLADIAWWFLLPVSSLIFSTLPALEAQTRLAIGKRLEYRVTDKRS